MFLYSKLLIFLLIRFISLLLYANTIHENLGGFQREGVDWLGKCFLCVFCWRRPAMRSQCRLVHFTLCELLVVVAFLAVLAVLGIPVYSDSLSKAQGVTCGGNLKAMGMALSIYSDDNDDVLLPAIRIYEQDPMQNWLYFLHYSHGLPNEGLMCPQERDTFAFGEIPPNVRPRMGFSYGMHYEGVSDNYNSLHPRFTRRQQREHGQVPSDHIWLGDSATDTLGRHPAVKEGCSALLSAHGGYYAEGEVHEGNGWYPVSVRHGGAANLLMFDGHVESLAGRELFAGDLAHWKPMFYDWKWQDRK